MVTKVSPTGLDLDELSVLDLKDTPTSFGTTGQVLVVNAGADGLSFATVSGGGATAFTDLTDGPGSLGTAGQYVAMNAGANALEFIAPPAIPTVKETFPALNDTPANYTGAAGQVVRVNAAGNALEFVDAGLLPISFVNLSDTPDNYTGADGKYLQYNEDTGELTFTDVNTSVNPALISFHSLAKTPTQSATNNGKYLRQKSDNSYDLEWVTVSGGASSIVGLSDTPATYGTAGQYLAVNSTATGFVFETLSGGGAAPAWGEVTGTLSSQTDLQGALDAKVDDGAVTSSGLTMATARILGRTTASTGAPEEITIGSGLSLSAGTLTASGGGGGGGSTAWGDITGTLSSQTDLQGALDAKVDDGAVTSSGLTMATAKLLGRTTASTGAPEEITVGSGLAMSAGTLTATGGGGSTVLVDQWRLTADLSPGGDGVDPITSNLSSAVLIGSSGMSVSSGIWTFPSTGFYKIDASLFADLGAGGGAIMATLYVSTNASAGTPTWTEISKGGESGNFQIEYGTINLGAIVDVTATADVKVKFGVVLEGNTANYLQGSSTSNRTFFTFERLADT